jgi:uncharacterized protein
MALSDKVDPAQIQNKIQAMAQRLVEAFDPDKIILFGSHAKGTGGKDSDVDLLVIKSVLGSKREERIAMRMALRGTGIAKDIVLATPEEVSKYQYVVGTLIRSALKEGKVLYERL